jgi:hypothetical protein
MITSFWVHIIRNILITHADTFSAFKHTSIYEDLLIALQLTHDTDATRISYDDDPSLWSIR